MRSTRQDSNLQSTGPSRIRALSTGSNAAAGLQSYLTVCLPVSPRVVTAIIACALAGCATEPPKLLTEIRTETIRVPVPVPCQVAIPKRPASAMPDPSADVARLAAGASADVRALGQHVDQLEAALIGCGGKP